MAARQVIPFRVTEHRGTKSPPPAFAGRVAAFPDRIGQLECARRLEGAAFAIFAAIERGDPNPYEAGNAWLRADSAAARG